MTLGIRTRRTSANALPVPKSRAARHLRDDVIALLQRTGVNGTGPKAIFTALDCSEATVWRWLRILKAEGLAEPSATVGRWIVWGPKGTRAHHQALRDARAGKRIRPKKVPGHVDLPQVDCAPFVHRIVPAAKCKPALPPCPVSVFNVQGWAA